MKWMMHDRKKNELVFMLEEHEVIDGMDHQLIFTAPTICRPRVIASPKRQVKSDWTLHLPIPEGLDTSMGEWRFHVISDPHFARGIHITATGHTIDERIVCHQALTKIA